MNPYPPAAEAVDSHLSKAIETLQRSTEQGIGRIESRMGEMATKDAVEAHVARLDQRDDHLELRMDAGFASVKADMSAGFAAISTRDAERDRAAEKRDAARDSKFARRMTWTLTIIGLIWGVTQFILAPIIQR